MAEKQNIKKVHDRIASQFGQGKSKLLAFMYQWAEQSVGGSPTCVYPVFPNDPRAGSFELAIVYKHMAGVARSGIYISHQYSRHNDAVALVNRMNRVIFGISHIQTTIIVEANKENQQEKDEILFNKAMAKFVTQLPADKILSTPGVYDAMKEEYEGAARDVLKRYQADPGRDNIEIKYDTRELLEMAITDMDSILQYLDQQKRNSIKQTIQLANNHLEAMDEIMRHRGIIE